MSAELDSLSSARASPFRRVSEIVSRYGLTISGAVGISGAHFVAAVLLLRALPPAEFGLISFVLVVVPFCLSMSGALLGASISTTMARNNALTEHEIATHMKASVGLSLIIGSAVGLLLVLAGGGVGALIAGFYAAVMMLRWFARSYSYAVGRRHRVTVSDFAYGGILLAALSVLLLRGHVDLNGALACFGFAASVAFFVFGIRFMGDLIASLKRGSLRAYGSIWRELTRWSLLGVVLTEITANAHAYVVTLFSGPKAFALLAIGSLFMRPVSLCLTALPDLERPAMAKCIAGNELPRARAIVGEFTFATAIMWFGTAALSLATLVLFPQLVLKASYDQADALWVLMFWILIMAVRTFRTPESVFLQSAREFRALASASATSSIASFLLTAVFLVVFGPVASLAGVLIGDGIMALKISTLSRRWMRIHG